MRVTAAIAILALHASAAASPLPGRDVIAQATPLITRDYLLASSDPGILVSVRFKATTEDHRQFGASDVVVMVHGATLASRPAFDPPLPEASWAEWLARRGHAVYLMDVRNYRGSTRDRCMDGPPDGCPAAPSRSFAAVRDIAAVVEHVRARHGLPSVDLIGWSWGGLTAGHFASLHPEKVRRLVLFAPVYQGGVVTVPYEPAGAYGLLPGTGAGLLSAWASTLRPEWGPPPWSEAVLDAVAAAIRASDPTSGNRDPPSARFPRGSFEDLFLARSGRPLWNASTITADTLVIRGERDQVAPAEHAAAVMRDLAHARSKTSVTVPAGTHFLQFDPARERLFEEVETFLRRQPDAPIGGR